MSKPSKQSHWQIETVRWQEAEQLLSDIRTRVFIEEQQVPVALEWDGLDAGAQHLLAKNQTEVAIGCARILPNGSIGRMAVLMPWRDLGVGTALLKSAIDYAKSQAWHMVTLSAQTHAIPFYERYGFKVISQPYLDAGILHQDMQLVFD